MTGSTWERRAGWPATPRRAGPRRAAAAALAGIALVTMSACASKPPPVFHPSAGVTAAPATQPPAAPAAETAAGAFHFPAGFDVTLQATAGPAGRQAVIAGYETYVQAFWLALATRGVDHRYLTDMAGNALAFAKEKVRYFRAHGLTLRGTAAYRDIKVADMYYGAGAVVTACVNVSAVSVVKAPAGARVGTVYSRKFLHYLEEVSAGKQHNGRWVVFHTANYPSTSSKGAVCQ